MFPEKKDHKNNQQERSETNRQNPPPEIMIALMMAAILGGMERPQENSSQPCNGHCTCGLNLRESLENGIVSQGVIFQGVLIEIKSQAEFSAFRALAQQGCPAEEIKRRLQVGRSPSAAPAV